MTDGQNIILNLTQARKWQHAPNWALAGWTTDQQLFYLRPTAQRFHLPAGGWSMSAVDLVVLEWTDSPDRTQIMNVIYNQNRIYSGFWRPSVDEVRTLSIFHDGDLYVLRYLIEPRS
jgi:hypothetical protein